ncbi:hypothetical protein, partial [Roseomonas rosulenta]|uniref:hypothetical protein n=1 Tax=Roseomonas rosulenta TaxID=2748667 RepID=UPI0018DFC2B3
MRKTLTPVILSALLAACGAPAAGDADQQARIASAAMATGNPSAALAATAGAAAAHPRDGAAQLRHAEMLAAGA